MKASVIISLCLAIASTFGSSAQMPADVAKLRSYIDTEMPKTVRSNTQDNDGQFGLPKPYSVPCIRGGFQAMFYWDTYFTNVGLIAEGNISQARNNTDNILYLINRLGYMPNASTHDMATRSQPPYASLMVREVYDATHDKKWLAVAVAALEKEYRYWMTKRIAPNGLNRYGHEADDAYLMNFYNYIASRLNLDRSACKTDAERLKTGADFLAEAESGWDFNPRFDSRCMDFNPTDLNANLFMYEQNFAYFYKQLGKKGAKEWAKKASNRKKLMNAYCLNPENGLFYDYDFVNGKRSDIYSAGVFNIFKAGLATKKQARAMAANLNLLEVDHGVANCQKGPRTRAYQWDYPNGWAAPTYMAIAALDRYGYKADASRIALKYVESNVSHYNTTGNLWEKYNAVTGGLDVQNEYAMPGAFMGWTAGTFIYACDYLYRK